MLHSRSREPRETLIHTQSLDCVASKRETVGWMRRSNRVSRVVKIERVDIGRDLIINRAMRKFSSLVFLRKFFVLE